MTDLTAKFGIWKHSHGTKQTTGWEDHEREEFMADSVLVIGDGLEQRQIDNFKKMRRGDFFYLCHGNNIQLLGQVATGILNPRARCLRRKYTAIRRLETGPSSFKTHRKRWSPGGNTTCWPVPEVERREFEKDILRPFFRLTLSDLEGRIKRVREGPWSEADELPPPIGPACPYKRPRDRRPHGGKAGETLRSFDPDKTGRRRSAHDGCLDRFSRLFRQGVELLNTKHGYDLAVVAKGKVLLVEAKTLRDDSERQLRLALGQLLYYQYRYEKEHFRGHSVLPLVITDGQPPGYMVKFLEKYGIGAVWLVGTKRGESRLGTNYLTGFRHALR
jgi:hypothetical protein